MSANRTLPATRPARISVPEVPVVLGMGLLQVNCFVARSKTACDSHLVRVGENTRFHLSAHCLKAIHRWCPYLRIVSPKEWSDVLGSRNTRKRSLQILMWEQIGRIPTWVAGGTTAAYSVALWKPHCLYLFRSLQVFSSHDLKAEHSSQVTYFRRKVRLFFVVLNVERRCRHRLCALRTERTGPFSLVCNPGKYIKCWWKRGGLLHASVTPKFRYPFQANLDGEETKVLYSSNIIWTWRSIDIWRKAQTCFSAFSTIGGKIVSLRAQVMRRI